MAKAESAAVAASERLRRLPDSLSDHADFANVLAALTRGEKATIEGVWGGLRALLAVKLAAHAAGPLLIVCPQQKELDDFCDELDLFGRLDLRRFPAWESEPGERVINDDIYADRLSTLKRLAAGDNPDAIVTSIESLIQPTPSRDSIAASSRILRVGQRVDLDSLLRWFARNNFHHTSAVELPGEYSHRGGILDLYAADWARPCRIEFFDDEIESIRQFEIASQRSIENLAEVEVTILEPNQNDGGVFASFLPDDTWVLLLDPQETREHGIGYVSRLEHPERFHSVESALQSLGRFAVASAGSLTEGRHQHYCRLEFQSVERFTGQIERVQGELAEAAGDDDVIIVCSTDAEAERLNEIFHDADTPATLSNHVSTAVGMLRSGFRSREDAVLVVSGAELFQRTLVRRPREKRLGKAIDSFLDLRDGDLVVHLAHGIGRYRGLQLLDKDGHVEEHLKIEFHGGTKIFVPAAKIDLVQKYIGGSKTRPKLARIGGKSWLKQKQAAESAVTDLAAEMLELQAQRAGRPGIAFPPDSDWQREFDAAFPYEETPDQRHAVVAIKSDMHKAKPMDRLLCGDVGFGKTEMAMRAAFKAIDSGYQVAVLVPTTVLAEQHYRSFRERMAEFPIDVGKLSRFASRQEQKKTIAGLANGSVDLVVGTHRLASKDVKFFNLGLIVIDEEQRFGVDVKERLKSMRSTVDVLTMSATPIPRTLHMSLIGVRDISNLETPPQDRVAVETKVTRFDEELIHHAVIRELNRGGQVYFVHNRVNDIEIIKERLERIVPEADIRIGHGQMNEGDLEKVMVDFVEGRFDVLLATTIVESGLDIPNANTIFIDEADRYGLADLHQLRGRVGRYKHRAYCYLMIEEGKHLNPTAAKRLRAIEEYHEMGAGFAIAMRDLEIRGAGNLLGSEQSGHIAAVGYEFYCQLLESAVRKLKQMPPKLSVEVDVDLPGEAHLPTDYVPEMRLKIDIYRRMTRAESFDDLRELRSELEDRFGPLPPPTEQLFRLANLKMEAAVWQIHAIGLEDDFLLFHYANRSRIEQLAGANRKLLRVIDDKSACVPLEGCDRSPESLISLAELVLRPSN